ncbi:MAG: hypothetical protein F6J87_03990 [Spirulina sp. SIO3F2]|nr:hypothetical protein [Spirulina sp. SIO3F2]
MTHPPTHTVEMQELGINLIALDFRPPMLNLDVLKFSGIIPNEWELAQEPMMTPTRVQLSFSNGVSLIAQPRQVTVLQATAVPPNQAKPEIPQIAQRYVEQFPRADYQGLSFAPKVLVGFPTNTEAAREFITGQLLGGGAWQQLGHAPLQASVTLNYQLKRCPLTIAISEVKLNQQEQQISALLFAGAFNYTIPENYRDRRSDYLSKRIGKWSTDLVQFSEVVHRKFLNTGSNTGRSTATSVFPELEES